MNGVCMYLGDLEMLLNALPTRLWADLLNECQWVDHSQSRPLAWTLQSEVLPPRIEDVVTELEVVHVVLVTSREILSKDPEGGSRVHFGLLNGEIV